ncbi:MAG TPA: 2-oxoacid:acceptor oxidoreductase family protein [Tissierellaceae bacterium]|nr:2-oxoacid:acceptor oxidoreductase family protein [Tissierellaceae bacterium]
MEERIIAAGFGGQGVMALGQMLTYAGMVEDKHVSWVPSYGVEMRGGTANCNVVISDELVGSPVVIDATTVFVLNQPSFDKFEKSVVPGGKLFVNSSLIDSKSEREDIDVYYVPANDIANELGNSRVTNMAMLGAYLEITKIVGMDSVEKAYGEVFGERKAHLFPINKEAIDKGAESVR